jgi:hypothetical protein
LGSVLSLEKIPGEEPRRCGAAQILEPPNSSLQLLNVVLSRESLRDAILNASTFVRRASS